MLELAVSLLAVLSLWALAEWRLGPLLCLATAILQDPLRKLVPHKPVFFVGFVAVVFAAACIGALARGVALNPNSVFGRYRLALPFSLFLLLLFLQALNSYLRFDNLFLPVLGLLTYVLPIPSIVFAYQLVCRQGNFRIKQFMKWYIVCIGVALTTVVLEYSGYRWPVFGQVGPMLLIFDKEGGIVPSYAGLFRASEIAAWHAMAAACFVVLLTFWRGINLTRFLRAAIIIALLVGMGLLTGRRKFVIELAVFISTFGILWAIFERGVSKLSIVFLATAATVGYMFMAAALREGTSSPVAQDVASLNYSRYVLHAQNAFQAAPTRFVELGIAPVMWAYDSFGLFGAGLGVGTQGTQYFSGVNTGVSEGGLGKITVELGVPGLLVMGWMAVSIFRYTWRVMRAAARYSSNTARLCFGLVSFIVANAAGFSVGTQAYGDLFILLILGWTLGFLFAVPVLIEREVRVRQTAFFENREPIFRPKTA